MNRIESVLLFLGISILPIYVFSQGSAQPSHLVLAIFSGIVIAARGMPVSSWSVALFSVFICSFLIECFYIIIGGDVRFLINSVFFLYNFILVISVYMYVLENELSVVMKGVLVAACIALATVIVVGVDLRDIAESGRTKGGFNNPNQLGYFSVCLLSFAYLFYFHKYFSYMAALLLFATSLFLAISSLSKAAMVANFLVILVALRPALSLVGVLRSVSVTAIVFAAAFYFYVKGAFSGLLFVDRLANMMGESDSSLDARGYFAFVDGNIMQMFFGLGSQGANQRVGHEVHSTLGSIVNNYGFVSLFLFSFVLFIWVKRLWRAYGFLGMICISSPAMLYGITHNGTRFTIFWLLFSASMAMAENRISALRTNE